ncbi:hypothetical protein ACP70R_011052 [Stipagrostis hirtigluma subsp. patula]
MGKRAGEREGQEAAAPASAPDAKKTRRVANYDAPRAGMCDDVVHNIFARLPARAAVASMALSKHHRRLIRSPEFRALHCRLAPPLPRPHVAYVATAAMKMRPGQEEPVSGYVGFHVAGGGLSGGDGNNAPMRALAGARYLDRNYVNTCNGVVLLASSEFSAPCRCVLWNPAVADAAKEVTVPAPTKGSDYLVLGLGYGRRSETYKLLLLHRTDIRRSHSCKGEPSVIDAKYSFVIHALGEVKNQQLQTVSLGELQLDGEIGSEESLYIDGKIYLFHPRNSSKILAFDVDDGTATSIDMPAGLDGQPPESSRIVSKLMELSDRLCVAINDGSRSNTGCTTIWSLSVDHRWEQKCLINSGYCTVVGFWDCGGVLVLYLEDGIYEPYRIYLYHIATGKMFKAGMPNDLAPDLSDYAICWGYRPTLVSPWSIDSKLGQNKERHPADIMNALMPLTELFTRKGREATMDIACAMDMLVRIMQKLPDEIQDVVNTPKMDSEDSDFFFQNVVFLGQGN